MAKDKTRNGKVRTTNDERRSWQRANRRSYNKKDQGSNQFAISAAKKRGTLNESPQTRIQKAIEQMNKEVKVERVQPRCTHCGSADVDIDWTLARKLNVRPESASTLLCASCQKDVRVALAAAAGLQPKDLKF